MDLPFEVLTLILSYLRVKDLIEVSTVSKTYYLAVRKHRLFVQSYLILGNCLTIKDLCLIIIIMMLALVSPTICLSI